MSRKKRKTQPWWKKPRNVRRLAMAAIALFVVVVGALYAAQRSDSGEPAQYLILPATPFSLPTTSGDEFVSSEHVGQHNLLLYFNEGMG